MYSSLEQIAVRCDASVVDAVNLAVAIKDIKITQANA